MNCRKLPDDPTKQRINSPRNGHVIVLTYFKNKKQHVFGSTTTASWLKHNLHLVTFFNVTGRWFLAKIWIQIRDLVSHDFQGLFLVFFYRFPSPYERFPPSVFLFDLIPPWSKKTCQASEVSHSVSFRQCKIWLAWHWSCENMCRK